MDRVLRILNTGDWNPHVFDYPTLVIYLHTLNALACFLAGVVAGWWDSLPAFDIAAVYTAARLLTAVAGVLTVWITYRIGVAIGSRSLGLLAAAQLAVLRCTCASRTSRSPTCR
jgi:asparagine N-glycosylation enzyme membrane subunit Stt3